MDKPAKGERDREPDSRTISLIVPFKEPDSLLRETLAAIAALDPPPFELVLVDDGSGQSFQPGTVGQTPLTLLAQAERRGPAAARNLGARHARGELLLFVDADVMLPPDTISRLCDFVDAGGRAGVGLYCERPRLSRIAARYKNLYMRSGYQRFGGKDSLPAMLTSAAVCRTVDFFVCGGFDESYRTPSVEDADLGRRFARGGVPIRLVPGWEIEHRHDYRLRELPLLAFHRAAAVLRLAVRWRGPALVNGRTAPLGYRLSLPLVLLATILVTCGLLAGQRLILAAGLVALGVIYVLNGPLLAYFARVADGATIGFAILFLPFDLLAHALGLAWGGLTFLWGRRY